jgi:hypothetical protein
VAQVRSIERFLYPHISSSMNVKKVPPIGNRSTTPVC